MGSGRAMLGVAGVLLCWLAAMPCHAQPPATLAPALPAAPASPAPASSAEPVLPPPRPEAKSPLEQPPPASGEVINLDPPALEAGDLHFPISLAAALRLADARPLVVAIAQAKAWIAEAQLQRARVLWVPAFMMNVAYLRHDGPIDFNQGINIPQGENAFGQPVTGSFGKPLNQNLNWFYSGVSLYQVGGMTDAIFTPLAARQVFNARRWEVQTAKNDALLRTARAYFNVHKYRGQYAGALYCVERGRDLVRKIAELSRDLASGVEIDRARNLLADLEQQAVSAREEWRVTSAELTRVLRLDPRAVVVPVEHDHMQLTLIDPGRSLDDLMPIGLTNRPELAAQQALVQAALVRIRQEKMRPVLPTVLITGWQAPGGMTTQVGIFGTGNGGKLNLWSFRDDISAQCVWQLDSFGFGNLARIKRQRGEQSRALATLFRIQDEVAADITRAQADMQSAAARVVQAERSLNTGLITFNRSLEGLGQTQRAEGNVLELIYRPQEVVYALQLLKLAFDEYFATVADYNIAQFEMFHALGYPAREVSDYRLPGEAVPLDTSRPAYLPPVGTGPPPATR